MLSWLKKYRYTALLYRIIQLSFKGNYWGGEGVRGANISLGIYSKIVCLRACAALVSRMLHFINFIPFLQRPVNITMDIVDICIIVFL